MSNRDGMAAPVTLLLVDDNTIAREGLGDFLRQQGYDVVLAANGEEAFARLRSGPAPDLILLDMLMPKLDGWQFLRQHPEDAAAPVPILVVTSTALSLEWARDHGCCGFIRKPIDPDALLGEIRRCLAERASRRASH